MVMRGTFKKKKKRSEHRIMRVGGIHVIHAERPRSRESPCECVCDPSVLSRAGIHIFDDGVHIG